MCEKGPRISEKDYYDTSITPLYMRGEELYESKPVSLTPDTQIANGKYRFPWDMPEIVPPFLKQKATKTVTEWELFDIERDSKGNIIFAQQVPFDKEIEIEIAGYRFPWS